MTPAALAEYLKVAEQFFANPQGSHRYSRIAMRQLDDYRERVAAVLACGAGEVFFTSGATESNNIAIQGSARAGGLVAASAVEHKAVLAPVLARGGLVISVDVDGQIDQDRLRRFLKEHAGQLGVVSIMAVNNETGVTFPVPVFAGMVHKHAPRALFHCDAVQAATVLDLAEFVAPCDMVSLSAHKFGGPKGTGILIAKDTSKVRPLSLGGSQEKDLRPGTHDLASIAAMTVALEAAQLNHAGVNSELSVLRDRFEALVGQEVPEATFTGANSPRSPAISHMLLPGVTSEEMLFMLDEAGIAASGGAACASGALDPSHVVVAMGVEHQLAKGALRFSFARSNTPDEIDLTAKALGEIYRRLQR